MIFSLFLLLTKSKRQVCICNNECLIYCPEEKYQIGSSDTKLSFQKFIDSHIQHDDELEIK